VSPARVQRSRARGSRLAPGARCVDRTTRYGNPFTVADALADNPELTEAQAHQACARLFALWLDGEITLSGPDPAARRAWILAHLPDLAGRDLACWCRATDPCHADTLLQRANPATTPRRD